VRLAVEGLTAREIGEKLFIDVRTVETHIANAYLKLEIHSRFALIRRARELGL
jgi:LuxR family maltose regulon positive regulatory protein